MESVLDGLRSGLIYQHIQFNSVTLHFASKHPSEMVGVFLYTSMKSFIQFLESKNFMESSDSILDGLVKKVKEEYDDTSMLILADYLERIGRVEDSQTIRNNVESKEELPQVFIAQVLGEKLPRMSKNHLYYEMVNFLTQTMRRMHGEVDEFSIEAAIKWFACDHYNGSGSDLYSICSTSEYNPGRRVNSIEDEDETTQELYHSLRKKYVDTHKYTYNIEDLDSD